MPQLHVKHAIDDEQWRSIFRQLVIRGFLSIDFEGYGALKLQEKCRPLLRGDCAIALRLDHRLKVVKRQTKAPLPKDIDVRMWESLRDCRRKLAEGQNVPPYVIFHDSTLMEMCRTAPKTLDDFASLTGVGERKLLKYGNHFLTAIRQMQCQ